MNSIKQINYLILLSLLLSTKSLFGQDIQPKEGNPKIKTYFSVVHPIATFSENGTRFNFDGNYTVGFPIGINFVQSERIAFSMEFVPSITATDSSSNTTGLLFHPGLIFRNIGGFNFLSRLAFNTNGRYGFTVVVNKPIIKRERATYFLAMPIPVRFGNGAPPSLTFGFQFGISF